MAKILERDGRAYLVEDGKIVKSASSVADLLPDPEAPPEFQVGDRVEANGKLGKVVSKMNTIYGEQIGVRYDDGEAESHFSESLTASEVEEVAFDSPIDEILAEADEYNEMSSDTVEQIHAKLAKARELNLRAKAMASDSKLPFSDRVKLESVVSGTQVDLTTLKDDKDNALIAEHEEYLASQPKYEMAREIVSSNSTTDDVSWLAEAADDAERELGEVDWDTRLAEAAVALVEDTHTALLKDSDTMMELEDAAFREASAGLDEESKADKLLSFKNDVRLAAHNKVEDEKADLASKEASTEDDDTDDAALFL